MNDSGYTQALILGASGILQSHQKSPTGYIMCYTGKSTGLYLLNTISDLGKYFLLRNFDQIRNV